MSSAFKVIIIDRSPAVAEVDCENGCVFVSRNALINKLKCKSKDWIKVWLRSDRLEPQLEERSRFCQIYYIESIDDEEVAYISPLLWFNLQDFHSQEFTDRPLLQPKTNLMISREGVPRHHPKYIKCINVALIQSPQYSTTNDFSRILKKYFDKKRYIARNDVIGVSSREDPLYQSSNKDWTDVEWPVVYFRVSLVEGDGYLVDTKHSKLYQSGTIHSLIPASLHSYYEPLECVSSEAKPLVSGLSEVITALSDILVPYLMPRNRVVGTVLVSGPSGSGKTSVVRSVCKYWNLNLYHLNCNNMIGETLTQTETKIKTCVAKASLFAPTVVLISQINILANNELFDESRVTAAFRQSFFDLVETNSEWPIIVIATNSEQKKLADNEMSSLFVHSIDMDCLAIEDRRQLLQDLIGEISTCDFDLKELAQKTNGFYFGDLKALVSKAIQYSYESYAQTDCHNRSPLVLSKQHINRALEDMQKLHSSDVGSVNVPDVQWDDIGGHEDIKNEILDTIQLPLECPQLLSIGFKRSGILLHGPPGTGKTLLAKAAASQCSLNFLSVKGPELINMFVGQSEENVRNVFARARKCAPAVIFFDELDSLAPKRGNSGDSGGVMDRVVSQLLAEMDCINKANDVFIIGATNRPDLLDSALLRPGRFDRLLYVGIAEDTKSRLDILNALTRKFVFDSDVDLKVLESKCRSGLSGADFYAICVNALTNALQRCIKLVDNNEISEEECQPIVQMSDFLTVLS